MSTSEWQTVPPREALVYLRERLAEETCPGTLALIRRAITKAENGIRREQMRIEP